MDNSSLMRLVALILAVIPAMIMFAYFMVSARVSFKVESLWNAFGFGAVIAFPCIAFSALFEYLIDLGSSPHALSFKKAFFMASLPEEVLKLGTVLMITWQDLDEIHPRRLFMMAIACGCGFACFENIIYIVEHEQWRTVAIQRSISAVPGHAFVSALMGYCIYKAVHSRRWWWGVALIAPIILHGFYDFFLFSAAKLSEIGAPAQEIYLMTWSFICFVIIEGAIAHFVLRRIIKEERAIQQIHDIGDPWQGKLDYIVNSPVFWGIVGAATLMGTMYFALDMVDKFGTLDFVFDQGFSVFTMLHALAFIVLMVTLQKRAKRATQV
jgi:RsiW-degrading membrane proteinase PrsW (M82 family)